MCETWDAEGVARRDSEAGPLSLPLQCEDDRGEDEGAKE